MCSKVLFGLCFALILVVAVEMHTNLITNCGVYICYMLSLKHLNEIAALFWSVRFDSCM